MTGASSRRRLAHIVSLAAGLSLVAAAGQAQPKHYKFAYDQPVSTGYGIAGNIFADKLKELSKGTMLIDQYPGGQLGQEPQVLSSSRQATSSSASAPRPTPRRSRRRPA